MKQRMRSAQEIRRPRASPREALRSTGAARLLACVLACLVPQADSPAQVVPTETRALLQRADNLRWINYRVFTQIVQALEARAARLSPDQADHLHFLEGWKDAYEGHDGAALWELKDLIANAHDRTLRFRAEVTAVHVLSMTRRYEDAFQMLASALQHLPLITDGAAREEGLADAAELYGNAGQYDLSLAYAQTLFDENWAGRGRCDGGSLQMRALYESGRHPDDATVLGVIRACRKAAEPMRVNMARMVLARLYSDQRRYDDAIRVLATHYDEVERLYNPRFVSAFNALLAEVYYRKGRVDLAEGLARRVCASPVDPFEGALVRAYQILYHIARDRNDFRAALAYHERFAEVDKGHLDDISARQLAFQRIRHESIARQLQLQTLHRQNKVLQLQKQLAAAAARTSRLQVLLLTVVLTFLGLLTALITLWAYRTKRLQLHFMALSRIDFLTGCFNRLYFIEQAESLLLHSRRMGLETSVVLWDADHFKAVNDRFGHVAGDSVLKRLTGVCQARLRKTDILGRFGGEEFVMLLPGCTAEEAARRADIVREAMCQIPVLEDGNGGSTVSASFGVTSTRLSGYELGGLLGHADEALYAAKRAGRNRVVIYGELDSTDPDSKTRDPGNASTPRMKGLKDRSDTSGRRPRADAGPPMPWSGPAQTGRGEGGTRYAAKTKSLHEHQARSIHGRKAAQDSR